MYEYGIHNIITNEESIIFGYSIQNAFSRTTLNPNEWEVWYSEYIDWEEGKKKLPLKQKKSLTNKATCDIIRP